MCAAMSTISVDNIDNIFYKMWTILLSCDKQSEK